MDKRKLFGTIIGLIFWSFCVIFFTYAYYDWRSDPTNVVLGIEDLSLECLVGADVEVSNIGPVLNYQDGVKTEFSINNAMTDNMTIELYLDITSISDNLLTDSLKYVLVADSTGGTNYDYNNPVLEGDFSNFNIGNNLVTQDLEVTAEITTNYQFIIYIDGNMYNDPNMQENSLVGNLLIGKCSGDSVPYDELVYQAIYSETDNSLTFVHTTPLTVGDTYNDKLVSAVYTGFETATYTTTSNVPWYNHHDNIISVTFEEVVAPVSTQRWFDGFTKLVSIDLHKLDTKNVTTMKLMFNNCSSLAEIDISKFNTINTTEMYGLFYNCSSLIDLDVSGLNTKNVKDMSHMFQGCKSLINLNLNTFNTSNTMDMAYMFADCTNLVNLNISNFNTSKVTEMQYMFRECDNLLTFDLSNWDTGNVINMLNIFNSCDKLTKLDVGNWNTSKVTNMYGTFGNCSNLTILDLSNWNTGSVTDMTGMFKNCSSLINLDLSSFDTSDVTNMSHMFYDCSSLTELDLSNFKVNNVTDITSIFSKCTNLTKLNMNNWSLDKIDNMERLFYNNSNLKELYMNNFNAPNAISMKSMFNGCNNLTILEINNWNTSSVEDVSHMFQDCSSLKSLDLSDFDTNSVIDMAYMFSSCTSLENLNLDSFDTSNVLEMQYMFYNCNILTTSITVMSISTTRYEYMFSGVSKNMDSTGNYIGQITINYIPDDPTTEDINESTEAIVDAMIATKSSNSNIVKGCYGDNCPVQT